MKITINCLIHKRYQYVDYFLKEIVKIQDYNRDKIIVNFLTTSLERDWEKDKKLLKEKKIDVNVIHVPTGDYITKIKNGLELSDIYAIKLDEDIFIKSQVWDFFIENITILDDRSNMFLSPVVTNGIPSVDMFEEQFLTKEERHELHNIYLTTRFKTNLPSTSYLSLEQCTVGASTWRAEDFYKAVYNLNSVFKGVHPVRFSVSAQIFINKCILERYEHFKDVKDFSLEILQRPYFCNSVFGIKKQTWLDVLTDNEHIYKDTYDEVPLNLYRQQHNLNMVFIKNGFAVHPSYNTINEQGYEYKELSDNFYNQLICLQ